MAPRPKEKEKVATDFVVIYTKDGMRYLTKRIEFAATGLMIVYKVCSSTFKQGGLTKLESRQVKAITTEIFLTPKR